MSYKGILSALRNRLKPRKNKEYLEWRAKRKKPGGENHHILSSTIGMKYNDLLLTELTKSFHNEITNKRAATEEEQITMLVSSLEELFDYVEDLQDQLSSTLD